MIRKKIVLIVKIIFVLIVINGILLAIQYLPQMKVDSIISNMNEYTQEDKILLVQEKNGTWSLPGGWCDVNVSVMENTIKEVKEEAGLDVVVKNVIAIQDREKHNQPIYAYKVCKIFMLCEVEGGVFKENSETIGFDYFTKDNLPILATEKNNEEQIQMCFDAYKAGEKWKTYFD